MAIINNGLPEGLHFKDIVPGDLLEVKWNDAPNEVVVVLGLETHVRRKDYKGWVSYRVLSNTFTPPIQTSIESDQVVRKLPTAVFSLVDSYVAAEGSLGK